MHDASPGQEQSIIDVLVKATGEKWQGKVKTGTVTHIAIPVSSPVAVGPQARAAPSTLLVQSTHTVPFPVQTLHPAALKHGRLASGVNLEELVGDVTGDKV